MESLIARQKISPRRGASAQTRPGFVSILEGDSSGRRKTGRTSFLDAGRAPVQSRHPERTSRESPLSGQAAIRRGAIRAQSELGERALSIFASLRKNPFDAAARGAAKRPADITRAPKPAAVLSATPVPVAGAVASDGANADIVANIGAATVAAAYPHGSALDPPWLIFIDELPDRILEALRSVRRFFAASPRRPVGVAIAMAVFLVLAAGAAYLSASREFPMPKGAVLPDESSAQELLMSLVAPEASAGASDVLSGPLPPLPVMLQMKSYTVRSGDSIASVAKRFGIRQDTVISLNNLKTAASFKVGLNLRIPNMDGVSHTVRRGDTLGGVARSYGIDVTKIADANDLGSDVLVAGKSLFIPGAKLSASTLTSFYGQKIIWPARGPISSPFGYRSNPFSGARTFHSAIDIVVNRGTPVKAAMNGKVADAGYNSVFGKYVILSHSEGYQTLYGHLDDVYVKSGQQVTQSTTIGKSGNTGQSTGPHLHFSLFRNGQALDPRKYIK
ncbi:MAG: peptidoglycan DD-metalloendopeptidase family protein [Rectinemataceae bacterium]